MNVVIEDEEREVLCEQGHRVTHSQKWKEFLDQDLSQCGWPPKGSFLHPIGLTARPCVFSDSYSMGECVCVCVRMCECVYECVCLCAV